MEAGDLRIGYEEESGEPEHRSSSADLYRRFTANANGSWLASLAAPRSLEDLALATSLGLQRTAVVAPALPESLAVADPSRAGKPHPVRAGSSAAARAAAQMSDGALLSLLLTASSGDSRAGPEMAPAAARAEPPHSVAIASRLAVSALDVSPASLLSEARSYLVAHPAVAFGPARTRVEAAARAAAAAASDAAARPAQTDGCGDESADGDAETLIAAPPAPAAVSAHPAVSAAFAPEFDRIYTRIALGLAPLAVSAALALDPGQSIVGDEGSAAASCLSSAGPGSVAATATVPAPGVSADVAAVRAQLVLHAAKRLTRLPDTSDTSDAAVSASTTSGAGGGAGASLAIAEAVLTALQDMLTDAGVVALVREAAAARRRL